MPMWEMSLANVTSEQGDVTSIDYRMVMTNRTFFITTVTAQRRALFRHEATAQLMMNIVFRYRARGKYRLHEFFDCIPGCLCGRRASRITTSATARTISGTANTFG